MTTSAALVSGDRPLVIQTEHLHPSSAEWLAARAELVRASPDDDPKVFERALASAAGMVVRTYTRVDAGLLERAPHLRVVGRAGVGIDSIDVEACRQRGVEVVYTPEANADAVAELVMAFTLDATRPRLFLEKPIGVQRWKDLRVELRAAYQVSDLTFGVVGMGRVGRRVARLASAFGARLIFNDLRAVPEAERWGGIPLSFEDVLRGADVLTLHVDGRRENRHLLDAAALRHCQDDVLIINTSRGFVVDDRALAAFLERHPAAQAIVDVHEPEPMTHENPLLLVPNARLTPHIGAATQTAQRNMSRVVEDVWGVLQGEEPRFPAP